MWKKKEGEKKKGGKRGNRKREVKRLTPSRSKEKKEENVNGDGKKKLKEKCYKLKLQNPIIKTP